MISSRKQKNVDSALQKLRDQNLDVSGMVCHVGKTEDRQKLIDEVTWITLYSPMHLCLEIPFTSIIWTYDIFKKIMGIDHLFSGNS